MFFLIQKLFLVKNNSTCKIIETVLLVLFKVIDSPRKLRLLLNLRVLRSSEATGLYKNEKWHSKFKNCRENGGCEGLYFIINNAKLLQFKNKIMLVLFKEFIKHNHSNLRKNVIADFCVNC